MRSRYAVTTSVCLLLASVSVSGQQSSRPRSSATQTELHHADSHICPAQQASVDKLASGLASLKPESQITQGQKDILRADLMAIADGAARPDPALVQQLADHIGDAFSNRNISNRWMVKLANHLSKVINAADVTAEEVNAVIGDTQAILKASNVRKSDVQAIVGDLKAIASQARN